MDKESVIASIRDIEIELATKKLSSSKFQVLENRVNRLKRSLEFVDKIEAYTSLYYRCPICKQEYRDIHDGLVNAALCIERCTPVGKFADFSIAERTVYGHDAEGSDNGPLEAFAVVKRPGQELYACFCSAIEGCAMQGSDDIFVHDIRREPDGGIAFGIGNQKHGDVRFWTRGHELYFNVK